MFDGTHQKTAHQLCIPKPHISFCRMHVDVDMTGIQIDKQDHHGMTVTRQNIGIGSAQPGQEQLVLDRSAIDEEELVLCIAPVMGRQSREPCQTHPFPFGVDAEGRFVAPLGERSAETGGEDEKPGDGADDNTDAAPLGYDRRMLLDRVLALYDAIQVANR